MEEPMRDTIVFDLDGTIADTAGDLIAAANAPSRRWAMRDALRPGRTTPPPSAAGARC
jgi:phosphoglycolate phosphatase-like HAD superfamily hydrolase